MSKTVLLIVVALCLAGYLIISNALKEQDKDRVFLEQSKKMHDISKEIEQKSQNREKAVSEDLEKLK
ncbi:MAG: hypothetical protein ACK5LP_00165 [Campylobacteraceae bacterium]